MKTQPPDEDRIPTLQDLVFPGNRELRRTRPHGRVEPLLASRDDDLRRDEEPEPSLAPRGSGETAANGAPGAAGNGPSPAATPDATDTGFASGSLREGEKPTADGAEEEDVSIEDLMSYLYPSQTPRDAAGETPPAATAPLRQGPAAVSATEHEAIRAAVRQALEEELDTLVDAVTAAVVARSRD